MKWLRSPLHKVRLWLLAKLDIYSPSGIFANEYPPDVTDRFLREFYSRLPGSPLGQMLAQLESEVIAEMAEEDRRLNVLVALHRARATANREATK